MSILTAEYDFDTDIAVKQEEAYAKGISIGLEQGISLGREKGISIGLERGMEQGAYKKALETAKRLIDRGYTTEEIADLVDLPVLQVQELSGQSL